MIKGIKYVHITLALRNVDVSVSGSGRQRAARDGGLGGNFTR